MATEDLLEAIAAMKLTECYSDPPLINGVALKNTVLKNIPKGNVFGEVRTLCAECDCSQYRVLSFVFWIDPTSYPTQLQGFHNKFYDISISV